MTDTGYFPPRSISSTRHVVGVVLTVLGTVFGPPAAAFAGFVAVIEWSGCFLSCEQANQPLGALLGVLALALLLSGPFCAAVVLRRWSAVGWSVLGVLAVIGFGLLALG